MRIGGLASGMDIDSLVSKLMKAERMPLQKMHQDRTWLTWQRDAYREANTMLLNFRSQLTDMKMSTTFRARTTSSTNGDLVSATATSAAGQTSYNISEVTQLATSATKVNGNSIFDNASSVDSSKSLAELSSKFITYDENGDPASNPISWNHGSVKQASISTKQETKTVNINLDQGIKKDNTNEMSVKVGNKYYEVVSESSNLTEDTVLFKVNDDGVGELEFKSKLKKGTEVKFNYTTNYQVDKMTTTKEGHEIKLSNQNIYNGSDFTLKIGDDKYTTSGKNIVVKNDQGTGETVGEINYQTGVITMNEGHSIPAESRVEVNYQYNYTSFSLGAHTENGRNVKAFNIKASQSLDSFVNEVNSADTGVNMFYDEMTGQMSLTRTETGNFSETEDEIITSGDFMTEQLFFTESTEEIGGENAKFTLNGLETNRTSNSFEISGVTFQLKKTFSEEDGKDVKINISNDSGAVFDNIKEFVDKYNEMIGKIQDKLQEERYRDYRPLTEKQREGMSEHEQELWEEKAKSGMLKGDRTLSSALNTLRRDFYTPVEDSDIPSAYQQLASIGIDTTANYLEGGKLEINEAELKSAIQENPEAIEELFTNDSSAYGQKGILQRLSDSANQVMDSITEKAGNTYKTESQYTIGKNLGDLDDRISAFEDRLTKVEDRYWRQFTEMEKAIQRMNSQSTYLMQQFGGGM